MVNDWSPEPPREAEEVSCNNSEISPFGLSSDSDDDNVHPEGYEPLTNMALEEAENEVTDNDSLGGDTEWFEQQNGDVEIDLPRDLLPQQASNNSLSQLWAGPARDIALGAEGAAAVRAAMEGFNLPPASVPAWASTVPEEQWTDMLRQRISTLQQHRQQ